MKIRLACMFLLLLMSIAGRSQVRIIHQCIRWGTSVPAPGDTSFSGQRLLFFENAVYDETKGLLPYCIEQVKWSNGSSADVRLAGAEYKPFGPEEKYGVAFPAWLPEKPSITHRLLTSGKERVLVVRVYPYRMNPSTGQPEKMVSYSLVIRESTSLLPATKKKKSHSYASNSLLASGLWYRMKVDRDGIYRITYNQLTELGFSDPSQVRIFGKGGAMLPEENDAPKTDDLEENAIWFEKGSDGIFNQGDYLLFYGKGPGDWHYDTLRKEFIHHPHLYATEAVYFITDQAGEGLEVPSVPSSSLPPTHTVTTFDDYRIHESDVQNLIHSGRQWLEPMSIINPKHLSFSFPNLHTAIPVRVSAQLAARSSASTGFTVSVNDTELFSVPIGAVNMGSYTSDYAKENEGSASLTVSQDEVTVTLRYHHQGITSSACWIDWIRVNAVRELIMTGDQMHFRNTRTAGPDEVSRFILSEAASGLSVWDITQPTLPVRMEGTFSDNQFLFTAETPEIKEYIAFRQENFHEPVIETTPLPNQNLHGSPPADLVIVSHPGFLAYAQDLADHRRTHDGLRVLVVTPEQIYHEFSSGMPDVSAIRNFMKMLYDRAAGPDELPRYLLLFGDGSYDNRSSDPGNPSFILTYQSSNSFSPTQSFATDDFFGMLDDDEGGSSGLLDIGIGRLPVSTPEEARAVVEKIIGYDSMSRAGNWRNILCFIGDDEDYNIHMRDADILATYIDTTYRVFNINKIYLDAYPQVSTPNGQRYPEVNEAINRQMEKGALIMNYTGHGNDRGLAHEAILGKNDIGSWSNEDRLPLFITATCEFGRFDDVEKTLAGEFSKRTSAGEMVLLNPLGGGIALLTTTRLVYSSPNFVLNRNFYRYVFEREAGGSYPRLGDVLKHTKNASGSSINNRNFILLGDPSMRLAVPELQVITEEINEQPLAFPPDTLNALELVTVSGYLADAAGNELTGFEGILHTTVYDKEREVETLDNDGFGPMSFHVRNNVLYKGKATIENGRFSFSFIVPRDIAYEPGPGRISYYAVGREEDAKGACHEVIIGGFAHVEQPDTEGPEIQLYMNDVNFFPGGITDENPLLLALVSDSSGINTTGTGIGHDIIAQLDNDQNIMVLNDYYEADTDSYRSGRIRYRLSELEEGKHRISLKVWDVYNNSSTANLEFVVASSARLALEKIFNYPNPLTDHTTFSFEHNRPGTEMEVLIRIFSLSGQLVKTLQTRVFPQGYREEPFEWNGLDENGYTIGRGIYVYTIRVSTPEGETAQMSSKLVILR
ncbi:MAG: type IX secretion system sortase PorU [Bacteroidales bacterium]